VEKPTEKPKPKYRPPKQRPVLDFRLIEWLKLEHFSDPLRAVRPPHFILSQTQCLTLTRANPKEIKSPSDITSLLNESSEWADEWSNKIFNVMNSYDNDLAILNRRGTKRKRN
jgi:hypothetical protein